MAFPILPVLLGVGLLALVFKGGSSQTAGGVACGDAMSQENQAIFDKAMALPPVPASEKPMMREVADEFQRMGYPNAANCLRVHHGL